MEWKKLVKREHKDLEKIMKRELNLFRNQDKDFYNILESNYEDLKHSLFKNDSLTKELIKIIKTMKKAKIDDLDEYAEDTDESFRSMIRLESNAIAKSRDNYLSNRESLVSLFSLVDKNLFFIKQVIIQFDYYHYLTLYIFSRYIYNFESDYKHVTGNFPPIAKEHNKNIIIRNNIIKTTFDIVNILNFGFNSYISISLLISETSKIKKYSTLRVTNLLTHTYITYGLINYICKHKGK